VQKHMRRDLKARLHEVYAERYLQSPKRDAYYSKEFAPRFVDAVHYASRDTTTPA
jgi:hypothetical protein